MGEYNSSVTRVWPVFDWLFRFDATGMTWLPTLLRMGSRAPQVDPAIHSNPGPLLAELTQFKPLPGPLSKALGSDRAKRIGLIRCAYESDIPPSESFLRWLLEHPERLTWPKARPNVDRVFSPSTQDMRKKLATDTAVRDKAPG